MLRTAASIVLKAKLVWTRYADSLSKGLALLALLTAFIAMFLGTLQNISEVSDDRIKADERLKSAQVRSKSTPHPTFSNPIQEFIHEAFFNAKAIMYLDFI